jgi:GxxExxY protein
MIMPIGHPGESRDPVLNLETIRTLSRTKPQSHEERQDTQMKSGEMTENEIGKIIVDCAVRLHKELGPGLLETVYEVLLVHLLEEAGLKVERQVSIPIEFRSIRFDEGFRADIVVEDKVILELKSVESASKAHKKQVITYLKLTGKKLGYLLNFGEDLMKHGITRLLNGQVK